MTDLQKRGDRSPVPSDWTYAPAPESTDIVKLQDRYELFIGGKWVPAEQHFTTLAPRDESPLAEVAQASAEDVADAVAAAREAFTSWSQLGGSERAKYLFRIARILQERPPKIRFLFMRQELDSDVSHDGKV